MHWTRFDRSSAPFLRRPESERRSADLAHRRSALAISLVSGGRIRHPACLHRLQTCRRLSATKCALVVLAAASIVTASCSGSGTNAGTADTSRTNPSSGQHVSLADLRGALVPLSDMPSHTGRVHFFGGGGVSPCGKAQRLVAPVAKMEVGFHRAVRTEDLCVPSELRLLFDQVSVYTKGTAAQRLADIRANVAGCATVPLPVPRIASDQSSDQVMVANSHVDFIYLRINASVILSVGSESPSNDSTATLVAFARKAYARATRKLGG